MSEANWTAQTFGPPANNLMEISAISPDSGFVGDQVTITASELLPQPQKGVIAVRLNGIQAKIISIVPGKLIAKVPSGATSGAVSLEMAVMVPFGATTRLIQVTVNGQTATGPTFTVTANPAKQLKITSISPKQGSAGRGLLQLEVLSTALPAAMTAMDIPSSS